MMNGSHAATGLLVGVTTTALFAPMTGVPSEPLTFALGALVAAGAALLPDIDHDQSTITQSAGPLTRGIAEFLQWIARGAYRISRTEHDPDSSGEHRGLIHTPVFAVLLGVLVALGTVLSRWVGVIAVWLLLSASVRSLRWAMPKSLRSASKLHWRFAPTAYSAAAVVGLLHLGALGDIGPFLGVLVTLGMITHSIGDGLTSTGIPFAWPYRLACGRGCSPKRCRGQRWRRLGVLPKPMRFATGSPVERLIEIASLLTAIALFTLHIP